MVIPLRVLIAILLIPISAITFANPQVQQGRQARYLHAYRADGMRTSKEKPSTGDGTIYRYDGQMGIQDIDLVGSAVSATTNYGLGARGIDYMEKVVGSTSGVFFPIYDNHET